MTNDKFWSDYGDPEELPREELNQIYTTMLLDISIICYDSSPEDTLREMRTIFNGDIVAVFDGMVPLEKADTANKRKNDALLKLERMEERLTEKSLEMKDLMYVERLVYRDDIRDRLVELCKTLGIKLVFSKYESDSVIKKLARECRKCVVATTDSDAGACGLDVYQWRRRILYRAESSIKKVMAAFPGLPREQVIDILILHGNDYFHIYRVRGKTLQKMWKETPTLEGLLSRVISNKKLEDQYNRAVEISKDDNVYAEQTEIDEWRKTRGTVDGNDFREPLLQRAEELLKKMGGMMNVLGNTSGAKGFTSGAKGFTSGAKGDSEEEEEEEEEDSKEEKEKNSNTITICIGTLNTVLSEVDDSDMTENIMQHPIRITKLQIAASVCGNYVAMNFPGMTIGDILDNRNFYRRILVAIKDGKDSHEDEMAKLVNIWISMNDVHDLKFEWAYRALDYLARTMTGNIKNFLNNYVRREILRIILPTKPKRPTKRRKKLSNNNGIDVDAQYEKDIKTWEEKKKEQWKKFTSTPMSTVMEKMNDKEKKGRRKKQISLLPLSTGGSTRMACFDVGEGKNTGPQGKLLRACILQGKGHTVRWIAKKVEDAGWKLREIRTDGKKTDLVVRKPPIAKPSEQSNVRVEDSTYSKTDIQRMKEAERNPNMIYGLDPGHHALAAVVHEEKKKGEDVPVYDILTNEHVRELSGVNKQAAWEIRQRANDLEYRQTIESLNGIGLKMNKIDPDVFSSRMSEYLEKTFKLVDVCARKAHRRNRFTTFSRRQGLLEGWIRKHIPEEAVIGVGNYYKSKTNLRGSKPAPVKEFVKTMKKMGRTVIDINEQGTSSECYTCRMKGNPPLIQLSKWRMKFCFSCQKFYDRDKTASLHMRVRTIGAVKFILKAAESNRSGRA